MSSEVVSDVWHLSSQAREYGARELMRRPCGDDFETNYEVEVLQTQTRIHIAGAGGVGIVFPHAPDGGLAPDAVGRFVWPSVREEARIGSISEFIAPHISTQAGGEKPLFFIEDRTNIVAGGDLVGAVVATLSRLEETRGAGRDGHQRFAAQQSLAWKHGFLDRPVVDEIACGLEVCIKEVLPGWARRPRRLRARVSHDVDAAGLPFVKRLALEFTTVKRRPLWTLREVGSGLGIAVPCYLKWLEGLVREVRSLNLDSSVYWLAAAASDRDSEYDPAHRFIRANTPQNCWSFIGTC